MRRAVILACVWCAAFVAGGTAAASDQCLSASELNNVGRMASVMAMGAAVRHCSRCLGPDSYPQIVKTYQSDGLMDDFWVAQKAIADEQDRDKFVYVDQLVRDSARDFSATLSADCSACKQTGALVMRLSSKKERGVFYRSEAETLAKNAKVKTCP
jgi:hypothetical protein